jgi:hypothetical protein
VGLFEGVTVRVPVEVLEGVELDEGVLVLVTVVDGVRDKEEQIEEPSVLVVPAGQKLHVVAADPENLPAGHSVDEVLPEVQALPAGQGTDIAAA